jgi:hypothetical protein
MAISHADFMKFTKEQVFTFALEKGLLDEDEAQKLVDRKVNGYALLQCSVDQAMEWYGLLRAPAISLVGQLQEMFPGEVFIKVSSSLYFIKFCLMLVFAFTKIK